MWVTALTFGAEAPVWAQSLGEALEQPAWEWVVSSPFHVLPQTTRTHDGEDAVICQWPFNSTPALAFIETAVTGPSSVNFWWAVNVRGHGTVFLDGVAQLAVDREVDWEARALAVPEGTHIVRWAAVVEFAGGILSSNAIWLDTVSLGPPAAPSILSQPKGLSVEAAEAATLAAEVSGPEPWTLRWTRDGVEIPAATNLTLSLTNVTSAQTGDYRLQASNLFGVVLSEAARLTVVDIAPVITNHPVSQTAVLGGSVTFTAGARGTSPITWRWWHDGVPVVDAVSSSLTIENIETADDGDYVAEALNPIGTARSSAARLRVVLAPEFTQSPISQGGVPGATLTLHAEVMASAPPTWQWYFNDVPMPGETARELVIRELDEAKLGQYRVEASNPYGRALSLPASVGYSELIGWGERSIQFGPAVPALHDVVALAGGVFHRVALRADGTIHVWGVGDYCQCLEPPTDHDFVEVATGLYESLALRADGTLAQWGISWAGPPPPEATNVVRLAKHLTVGAMAIREDGTPVWWRQNGLVWISAAATNVVQATEGYNEALFLRADGTIHLTSAPSLGVSNVVGIASGEFHHLVLRSDGTLKHLGNNEWGQANIPAEATNIVFIACGASHDLAIRDDGKVLAWGSNPDGESDVPAWATNVVAVEGTGFGSLALRAAGPPRITSHPLSASARTGDTFRFLAGAVGANPLQLQWLSNGVPVPGQTKPWLLLTNVQPGDSALFALRASNPLGSVTSRVASMRGVAESAPRLLVPLQTNQATLGRSVVLQAGVGGSEPMQWRWRKGTTAIEDGERFSGATTAMLTIRGLVTSDAGLYSVAVTNPLGSLVADRVRLRVEDRPAPLTIERRAEGGFAIAWGNGVLEQAAHVEGPWTAQPDAVPPFLVTPEAGPLFFRVRP